MTELVIFVKIYLVNTPKISLLICNECNSLGAGDLKPVCIRESVLFLQDAQSVHDLHGVATLMQRELVGVAHTLVLRLRFDVFQSQHQSHIQLANLRNLGSQLGRNGSWTQKNFQRF